MGHCCVGWWSRCIPLFHQLHSELQRSFRTSRWWQGGWWATFIPPSERRLSCWLCTIIPYARCTNWMEGRRSSQTCLLQGSQPELQSELARHDEGKILEQFIDLAIRLDNLLHSRWQPCPSLASALTATAPPETEPMQIGFTHLSGEERERHIRQNLCLYCGRPGHMRASCPTRPPCNTFAVSQNSSQSTILKIPVMLRVKGTVIDTTAFIDSGAALNFIAAEFTKTHNIALVPCESHLAMAALDRRPLGSGRIQFTTEDLTLRTGALHTETIRLFIFPISSNPSHLGPTLARET